MMHSNSFSKGMQLLLGNLGEGGRLERKVTKWRPWGNFHLASGLGAITSGKLETGM